MLRHQAHSNFIAPPPLNAHHTTFIPRVSLHYIVLFFSFTFIKSYQSLNMPAINNAVEITFESIKEMKFFTMNEIRESLKICAKNENFALYTINSVNNRALSMDCHHFGNPRNCKVITNNDLARKKEDLSIDEAFVVNEEGKVLQSDEVK